MFQSSLLSALIVISLAPTSFAVDVINAGVGGNRTPHLLARLERDVLSLNPTAVVLMVGTNDRLNSGGFVAPKEYQKNVETLVDRLQAAGANVILVTPPPCVPELLFTRHDPQRFATQSPVARMAEVRQILIDIATVDGLLLVDFHDHVIRKSIRDKQKTSVLRNEANSGVRDGVHLTPEGYELLAQLVAKKLTAEKVDTSKIVCFGDSLTKGSDAANYPAFLRKFLNGNSF